MESKWNHALLNKVKLTVQSCDKLLGRRMILAAVNFKSDGKLLDLIKQLI